MWHSSSNETSPSPTASHGAFLDNLYDFGDEVCQFPKQPTTPHESPQHNDVNSTVNGWLAHPFLHGDFEDSLAFSNSLSPSREPSEHTTAANMYSYRHQVDAPTVFSTDDSANREVQDLQGAEIYAGQGDVSSMSCANTPVAAAHDRDVHSRHFDSCDSGDDDTHSTGHGLQRGPASLFGDEYHQTCGGGASVFSNAFECPKFAQYHSPCEQRHVQLPHQQKQHPSSQADDFNLPLYNTPSWHNDRDHLCISQSTSPCDDHHDNSRCNQKSASPQNYNSPPSVISVPSVMRPKVTKVREQSISTSSVSHFAASVSSMSSSPARGVTTAAATPVPSSPGTNAGATLDSIEGLGLPALVVATLTAQFSLSNRVDLDALVPWVNKSRKGTATRFRNQVSVKLATNKVSLCVFANGTVKLTGCRNESECETAAECFLDVFRCDSQIDGYPLSNPLMETRGAVKVVMRKADSDLGFRVDLDRAFACLKDFDHLNVDYTPDTYCAIKIRVPVESLPKNAKHPCVMVFGTGKVMVAGNATFEQLNVAFEAIACVLVGRKVSLELSPWRVKGRQKRKSKTLPETQSSQCVSTSTISSFAGSHSPSSLPVAPQLSGDKRLRM